MKTKTPSVKPDIDMSKILIDAVNKPGRILEAYQNFSDYSLGNTMAALYQAAFMNIPFGPLATYKRWQELGRQVKRGEKAIWLCRPVTLKRKDNDGQVVVNEDGKEERFTVFTWERKWFILSQTEGKSVDNKLNTAQWDKSKALSALNIKEVPFQHHNGNVQGYASGREVAINPVAQLPLKTLFHKTAHVLLGHTEAEHGKDLPRNLQEIEAESVALICVEALRLEGAEYCRGYIQNWLRDGKEIPEKSAHRIFKAADAILKAGVQESKPKAEGIKTPLQKISGAHAKPLPAKPKHGVTGDQRQDLLDQLLVAYLSADELTAKNSITVQYSTTTYTIKHDRKSIERVLCALGFKQQVKEITGAAA